MVLISSVTTGAEASAAGDAQPGSGEATNHCFRNCLPPANSLRSPSCASIHFAIRSDRANDPTLSWSDRQVDDRDIFGFTGSRRDDRAVSATQRDPQAQLKPMRKHQAASLETSSSPRRGRLGDSLVAQRTNRHSVDESRTVEAG